VLSYVRGSHWGLLGHAAGGCEWGTFIPHAEWCLTRSHIICLAIDLAVIWYFWVRLRSDDDPIKGASRKTWMYLGGVRTLCVVIFSACLATFPGERVDEHLPELRCVPTTWRPLGRRKTIGRFSPRRGAGARSPRWRACCSRVRHLASGGCHACPKESRNDLTRLPRGLEEWRDFDRKQDCMRACSCPGVRSPSRVSLRRSSNANSLRGQNSARSRKSVRLFKGIICDDISEFESQCLMLMIWSSRARNRSADPVVSCFFGRIAPSDAATESCFSIRGNRENEIASFQGLRHGNLAISSQQSRQKTTLAQWVRNSSRATSE